MADSNHAIMDKFYYYSIITKQCIDKTIYDIGYQKLFPDISSPTNIWNMSDDESDEEDSLSNYYTEYSDHICFVISKLWIEIEKHVNTDYAVTGWILCVIPHIREDVFKNSNRKPLIRFGVNIQNSIIRMILLTVINVYGVVKIFVMLIFICGVINTLYHSPKSLVLYLAG